MDTFNKLRPYLTNLSLEALHLSFVKAYFFTLIAILHLKIYLHFLYNPKNVSRHKIISRTFIRTFIYLFV
jgi:hypothetical protein